MQILYMLKDKKTKKTVGYAVLYNGETKNLTKEQTRQAFTQYVVTNAVLVNGDYVRLNKGRMPVEYLDVDQKDHTSTKLSYFKDYSNLEEEFSGTLGGVNLKYIVIFENNKYILKMPKEKAGLVVYDHITEFLGCKIAKELGYPVQEVELGYYNGKECVAVKMFHTIPTTYDGLGESSLEGNTKEYNLDWLLNLQMGHKFDISQQEYRHWVMRVFLLDMFVSNFDRHENNWGFLKEVDDKYRLAPLYDFGASLYPKFIGSKDTPKTEKDIKHVVLYNTKSAIIYKGKKRNYFDLLKVLAQNTQFLAMLNTFTREVKKKYRDGVFEPHLKVVEKYNPQYKAHMDFTRKMLEIKIEQLELLINDL